MTRIEGDPVAIANADGNFVVTATTGRLATEFTYDAAGRKLTATNGAGETTQMSYDLRGNVIASQQPLGQVNRAAFDEFGHQIGSQDPTGSVGTWAYDSFGQLQGYQDIGGKNHFMFYDSARQLIRQTSDRAQDIRYAYDNAGQLVGISDVAIGQDTQYRFDAAGHRVRETTIQGGTVYQDNRLEYDGLGRVRQIRALDDVNIRFDYDAVGNKIHQHTEGNALARSVETTTQVQTGFDESGAAIYTTQQIFTTVHDATSQELWFAYDSMNRQTLVDGLNYSYGSASVSNINSAQGHVLTYDLNGNRTSDTRYGQQVTTQELTGYDESGSPIVTSSYANRTGAITEYYGYDAMNRLSTVATGGFDVNLNPLDQSQAILLDVRAYDGAGRLVRNGPAGTAAGSLPAAYIAALNAGGQSDANGAISRVNRYDANGRLMAQHVTKADGSFDYDTIYAGTYTSDVLVETGQDESGNPVFTAQTITQTGPGYDAAGNILGYRVTDSTGITSSYNMTLARFEGYKEATVSGFRSDTGEVRTSTNNYDVNGHLVGITDDTGVDTAHRQFVNDANGIVLQKTQQANVFKQLVVMGQVMASYGLAENPQSPGSYTNQTTFDTHYQPITSGYPSAGTGSYTVRTGDSLQTIAQAAYGDSQLWYLIADANGLGGNSDLRVGQTVSIPTKVGSIHNTAGTYKPYDPSRVIGSTTPTLPVPQSGGGDDCGGLGLIIMIIVAVVVVIATEGAASEWAFEMTMQAAAAEGATAATVATTATLTSVAAGAAVGAAASIASQLVGMAIGAVDEFSWKAVALSAISGGITQGLPVGDLLGTTAGTIGNTIVRAAVVNATTQGIAVATGLQDRFDWRGVAASAIGAGVGASVGKGLGTSSSMGEQVFKASLTGLAAGTATALARGGRVSVQQIASDAFGNALGSSLGAQISQGGQQEDRLGNFINEQEAAQTQRDNAAAKTSFRQSEIAYQNESESAPTSMGGGSGLRLGGGGIGIRFPSSAVKDWSDGIDGGIMLNGSIAPAEERRALRTYTVQPGDNPASIGVKFFGDSRAGATILADNGLDASVRGTRNLPVGTVLTLRDDISEGNLRAGGRLIGADTSIRAQERAAVAEAQATADQARYDAMRMGAWSGRMNQVGSSSVGTGAGSSAGGHFEVMPSMDIAGGGMTGGTEQVWVSDGPAMAWGQSVGNAASAVGNGLVGVAEVVVGGAYNYGVRLAGGAASIPYVLNSVDAAVAVQEGFKERFGYDMRSSGAFAIGQALQPIGQWTQNSVMTPARGYSEALIGNGATTILGGVAQAGLEIVGVVTGGRAAQSFLENSVFVTRPVAGLYGGIPVDALFGSTRITTVTAEMSERFQGMGYVNPLTNKFTVAPLGETMAVDHIFPSTEIVQLRGFNTLTKQQMTSIIQDSTGELGNLQPLPKTFNSSKGSDLNWTTYKGQALDSTYVTTLEAQQRLVRSQIQSQIRSYQQQNLLGGR